MAEFLSPGVFIEEVTSAGVTIESVSTSTMAIVGWTTSGPTNNARLVTGIDDFSRKFGEYTNDSRVPISVQAFFNNGGARAYVVRVVPTDALVGESCVIDAVAGEALGLGTGADIALTATTAKLPLDKGSVVVSWRNDPAGSFLAEAMTFTPALAETAVGPHTSAPLANIPLTDAVVTLNWTESVQAAEILTVSAGPIVATDSVTVGGTTYTFIVALASANDIALGGSDTDALNNLVAAINDGIGGAGEGTLYGTGTVKNVAADALVTSPGATADVWAIAGGTPGNALATTTIGGTTSFGAAVMSGGTDNDAKTATITGTSTVGGADAARISAAALDRDTGILATTLVARTIGTDNGPDAASMTADYDAGGALQTATDDGAGGWLPAATAGGTSIAPVGATGVDYETGALDISWTGGTDLPFLGNDVTVDYGHCLWQMDAADEGDWSNRLIVRVEGNDNFLVQAPASVADAGKFTKFDVTVFLTNTITGQNEVRETYEEVVFDDDSDPLYFPVLINEQSSFFEVNELTATMKAPDTFTGVTRAGEVLGTGDATPTTEFTGTLLWPALIKTSMVITYEPAAGGSRELTADASGSITGIGLDTTKSNTINYTTGVFVLNFLGGGNAPADTKDITADYISYPSTSLVDYTFSDGFDGTLSGATFDRGVFSSPILAADKLGMYALDRVDEVMQLVIPDFAGDTVVMGDQIDYAELRGDLFNIFTTPAAYEAQKAKDFQQITFGRRSKLAAMYWPWIKVSDPLNATRQLTIPPIAHIAGIYARTDSTKNVGKAPGGTIDGALRFLTGLEKNPDKGDRDLVYPARINPLINTPQTSLAVWGVRSMAIQNNVLRYVNAVRLFQFVEKSTFNSTQGFVFESVTSNLYNQIKTTMDGFLLNLFTSNHFAGNTPDQAFFVVVDESNNPPEVANAGQVIVDIGIAPNRPGEFIRFRFAVKTIES